MSITGIRIGDIVLVDKRGRRFLAYVTGKEPRKLAIRPLDRAINYFEATSHEVIEHYKKMGRPRG